MPTDIEKADEIEHKPHPDVPQGDEVAIAVSGGGIRSGAFFMGALQGMFGGQPVSQDKMDRLAAISAVSGGSYTTSALATHLLGQRQGTLLSQALPAAVQTLRDQMEENSDYLSKASLIDGAIILFFAIGSGVLVWIAVGVFVAELPAVLHGTLIVSAIRCELFNVTTDPGCAAV